MRHLRPIAALFAIAALTIACSGPPGSSSGGASSQAAGASQPPASTGGGGGGGGGGLGANGSVKYEITGDATKSGELSIAYINGGVSQFINGGWVAYFYSADEKTTVQINSNPDTSLFNFGDGEILIVGSKETGCTFNYSQNDASGLKGTVDCQNVLSMNSTSGAQLHLNLRATVDAHT